MEGDRIVILNRNRQMLAEDATIFELNGYRVFKASTISFGSKQLVRVNPSLVILGMDFSDGNGVDFCRYIRSHNAMIRILFLSEFETHEDLLEGLRAGADDCLKRPYLPEELLLRVKSLLRRHVQALPVDISYTGNLQWHKVSHQVSIRGEKFSLTPREYTILELLCANNGKWVSTNEIYRVCWNSESNGGYAPVHNHIYCLRSKLKRYHIEIQSKRGYGYKITLKQE